MKSTEATGNHLVEAAVVARIDVRLGRSINAVDSPGAAQIEKGTCPSTDELVHTISSTWHEPGCYLIVKNELLIVASYLRLSYTYGQYQQ